MTKAQLITLEKTIQRKQDELDTLEEQIINGKGGRQVNQDEVDKVNRLMKYLEKYRKFLLGELESAGIKANGSLDELTTALLGKYNSVLGDKKDKLAKQYDATNEYIDYINELKKKRKELAGKIKANSEALEQQNQERIQSLADQKSKLRATKKAILEAKKKFAQLEFPEVGASAKFFLKFLQDAQKNYKNSQQQVDDHFQNEDELEKEYDEYIRKQNERIKKLKEQIEANKKEIEQRKNFLNERNLQQAEADKIKKEVADLKEQKQNYAEKFDQEIRKRHKEWLAKLENIDHTALLDIKKRVQSNVDGLIKINDNLVANKDALANRHEPVTIVEKPSIIPVPPAGIRKYIAVRNEAKSLCQDKSEIKYFLIAPDRLIQIYKNKKKQRDDTKTRYDSNKVKYEQNYQNLLKIKRKSFGKS